MCSAYIGLHETKKSHEFATLLMKLQSYRNYVPISSRCFQNRRAGLCFEHYIVTSPLQLQLSHNSLELCSWSHCLLMCQIDGEDCEAPPNPRRVSESSQSSYGSQSSNPESHNAGGRPSWTHALPHRSFADERAESPIYAPTRYGH